MSKSAPVESVVFTEAVNAAAETERVMAAKITRLEHELQEAKIAQLERELRDVRAAESTGSPALAASEEAEATATVGKRRTANDGTSIAAAVHKPQHSTTTSRNPRETVRPVPVAQLGEETISRPGTDEALLGTHSTLSVPSGAPAVVSESRQQQEMRPKLSISLGASSRPSQRRVSRGPQPRQQRKPRKIEPFEIRGSEKRPWTGHERGEHVPLGHAYMKNGGHQDRTRPYVRPGDQTVSRTSSMSTNARVRQSAEYLSNQRERDLRYGGFRRVKDASRPHTPEFWFKQSLDGSRIDIAAAGVFSRDAAAAAAPHRCLIRTKAINARRGSILDRTTDVGSMMDMGALGISHDTENALPASDHARVVNASRPNTSDNTVPRSAVRRVGSYHAGLSENDEGWLVNQMTSERDFTLCKDPFLEYA